MSPARRLGGACGGRALLLLAFSFALTAPVWTHPTSTVLGSWRTDTVKHIWSLWLGRHLVADGHGLWGHTDLANHPHGMEILVIEPLGALFAVLLGPLSIPLVANLLAVVNLLLLGLFTCALGDRLTGDRVAGLVAALLLMGSSTTAFFFHLGVGEIQHIFVIPMVLWALERLRSEPRWSGALLLAASLWLAMLSGYYLALLAGLAALAGGLGALLAGPRRLPLLGGLMAAGALAAAPILPLVQGVREAGPVKNTGAELDDWALMLRVPPTEDVLARVDLARLMWPTVETADARVAAYVGGQYLGPVLVGLALVGLLRAPRPALALFGVALSGVVLGMGSKPVWNGAEVALGGAAVLPYAWLGAGLNSLAAAPHYPSRFLFISVVALAALAALGVAGLRGTHWRVGLAALLALGLADVNLRGEQRWPWPVTELPEVPFLEKLAQVEPGAVVDLSWYRVSDQEGRNLSAWYQVGHGQPTQSVAISRLDRLNREGAARVLALPLVRELRRLPHDARSLPAGPDYTTDLALLREDGFAWLLLYAGRRGIDGLPLKEGTRPPGPELDALMEILGPPTFQYGNAVAWRLPEVQAAAEVLASARADRDRRIAEAAAQLFDVPR